MSAENSESNKHDLEGKKEAITKQIEQKKQELQEAMAGVVGGADDRYTPEELENRINLEREIRILERELKLFNSN